MALESGTPTLSPIQVPRASDVLATALRDQILSGRFPEGRSLPTERELIVSTETSRTTVREALRILESQGFVEMRTGRAGGPFVKRPGSEAVAQSVRFAILGDQTSDADLHETRSMIEPSLAALAARYRTQEDLELMDEASRELDVAVASGSREGFVIAKMRWHLAVSQASHNILLIGLMKAIAHAIYEITDAGDMTEGLLAESGADHDLITAAIRSQNPAKAERLMREHVSSDRRLVTAGPQTRT